MDVRSGPTIARLPWALAPRSGVAQRLAGRRPAVFLDYDGTLTPIVEDPAAALLPEAARSAVRRLVARVPLAIVSGRDLQDVRRLVAIDGIWYAGSHGFDIVGPEGSRHERAPETRQALDAAERELEPRITAIDGARLERKRYALAVHYRQVARRRLPEVSAAVEAVAAGHPDLRRTGGKQVIELRPDIDWDKGRAIMWLLETMGPAGAGATPVYIGDDETDEDAFRVVAGRGLGIVVRGEADQRPTVATLALDSPDEVPALLDAIGAAAGQAG